MHGRMWAKSRLVLQLVMPRPMARPRLRPPPPPFSPPPISYETDSLVDRSIDGKINEQDEEFHGRSSESFPLKEKELDSLQ